MCVFNQYERKAGRSWDVCQKIDGLGRKGKEDDKKRTCVTLVVRCSVSEKHSSTVGILGPQSVAWTLDQSEVQLLSGKVESCSAKV